MRSMVSLGPKLSSCGQRRLWSDWTILRCIWWICVRFQIIKLKWNSLLSNLIHFERANLRVTCTQPDRYHSLCFPTVTFVSQTHIVCNDLGWMDELGVLRPFQQYFSHIGTMEGWTWKALCNEAPFRFWKNVASSGMRTRYPVIRSRER